LYEMFVGDWCGVRRGGGGDGGGEGGKKKPQSPPHPPKASDLHLVYGYKAENGRVKPVCCKYKVILSVQNKHMVYEVKINTQE